MTGRGRTPRLTIPQAEAMRRFKAGSVLVVAPEGWPVAWWETPEGRRHRDAVPARETVESMQQRGLLMRRGAFRLSDDECARLGLHQCVDCGRPTRGARAGGECAVCEARKAPTSCTCDPAAGKYCPAGAGLLDEAVRLYTVAIGSGEAEDWATYRAARRAWEAHNAPGVDVTAPGV